MPCEDYGNRGKWTDSRYRPTGAGGEIMSKEMRNKIEKKQIGACAQLTYEVLGEPGLWNIKSRALKDDQGKTDLKQTVHLYLTKDSTNPNYTGGGDLTQSVYHCKCTSCGTKTPGGPTRKTCIAKSKQVASWCSKCAKKVAKWRAAQEPEQADA